MLHIIPVILSYHSHHSSKLKAVAFFGSKRSFKDKHAALVSAGLTPLQHWSVDGHVQAVRWHSPIASYASECMSIDGVCLQRLGESCRCHEGRLEKKVHE